MNKDETIIGYFAATNMGDVVCDGPACIIAGSYKTMKDYLATSKTKPRGTVKIIKTRFGEILSGMRLGAAYSFDAESYSRFFCAPRPLINIISTLCANAPFKCIKAKLIT
jgi:hypothetical protein